MQLRFAMGRYAAAAVRRRPQPRAALVGQLLLGEPVLLEGVTGRYAKVRLPLTGQCGFTRLDHLEPVAEPIYREQLHRPRIALDLFGNLLCADHLLPLTFGARLPEFDGLQGRLSNSTYLYNGGMLDRQHAAPAPAHRLVALARRWLHVPEAAAGRTPTGVGAPELVHLLYSVIGISLPVAVRGMQQVGEVVGLPVHCRVGDIAFFDGPAGRLSHPGIIVEESHVLHVDGCVRIDPMDHFGIFAPERRAYSHFLRSVKRVADWPSAADAPLPERYAPAERADEQLSIF
jgi:hypothetical protein